MRQLDFLFVALSLSVIIAIAPRNAQGGLVFDVTESGGNVEVDLSGTMNLSATQGLTGTSGHSGFYRAEAGVVGVGVDANVVDVYAVDFGAWLPYGAGGFGTWDVTTGSSVALTTNPNLFVPNGYVSGTSLSGSATKLNASFASLGFTPGSYVTTLTNGANTDTVTINIGAVPEPSSVVPLFSMVGAGLGLRRNRRSSEDIVVPERRC